MSSRIRPLLAVFILLAAASALAQPRFTREPAVSADAANVRITFAVSERTDVEVAIIDNGGRVIRHLAAGLIGKKEAVASPLTPDSLEQSLLWDRRDDLGLPVTDAACKVRVRIGMSVAFGRIIGHSPYIVGSPRAIAADPKGNVFLMTQSYRAGEGKSAGPKYIQLFDRSGKYVRTLMPYSASLPRTSLAGFGLIDTAGPITPRNYEGTWPQIYPNSDALLAPVVPASGRLLLFTDDRLFFLDPDGGASDGHKGLPLWPPDKPKFNNNQAGPIFIALTPDSKRLYIAGPYADPAKADPKMKAAWPKGRVYVLDLEKAAGAQPFIDVPTTRDRDLELPVAMRTARRGPHGPVHGIATDPAGNLYVCDRANNCVAVYSPDAKPIRTIPAEQPHLVAVHPKNGKVWVVTMRPVGYGLFESRLLHFGDPKRNEPTTEIMKLPQDCGSPLLALDPSSENAVWLTSVKGHEVWRIEQREDELVVTKPIPLSSDAALYGADRIAVDRESDDVYVNDGWSCFFRYNGLTGEQTLHADARALRQAWERDTNQRTNLTATDAAVGPDGFLYLRNGPSYSGPITRWDRSLRPFPFAAANSHVLTPYIYSRFGAGYGERGFDVHPDGRVFVLSMFNWNAYFVHVLTPEGKPVDGDRLKGQVKAYGDFITSGLVGPLTAACGGLKVDAAGNVYVGMRLFPNGFRPPKGFEKDGAYNSLAGSVFKFAPTGGGVMPGKGNPNDKGVGCGNVFVDGALKAYPDFAPFSGGHGSGCVCRNPRFDLDPFGRLYVPNALRNSVAVLDNAGNEILRFGHYGNTDDAGKDADIPLGWPIGVGASNKHVYVSDMLNKRVVRADISYAAAAEITVPPGQAPAWPDAATRAAALAGTACGEVGKICAAARTVLKPLELTLLRQTAPATPEDARVNLCHLSRLAKNWPLDELRALAEHHLSDPSPRVRLAALWAVDRDDKPEYKAVAVKLAKAALKDEDERVRTLAAALLFDRAEPDCFAPLLAACQSKDQWVLDLARPLAKECIILDSGPKSLRFPGGPKEIDLALQLLDHPYNNTRWVAAGILMVSANPRARAALAKRLEVEDISFIRVRLLGAARSLRLREATKALLSDLAAGPGDRKKGTGWGAAEAIADIGDPDAIEPLTVLLEKDSARDLALFALSRAFDPNVTTACEYRLIPDPQGRFTRVPLLELPPAEDLRKAWHAFWSANKDKFPWDDKAHPLRKTPNR